MINLFPKELMRFASADQSRLDSGKVEEMLKTGILESVENAEEVFDLSVAHDLFESVDHVIDTLATITHPGQQYVFSGASTEVSRELLQAGLSGREDAGVVADSFAQAVFLDSDENQILRGSGHHPKVQEDAIIIDEYAKTMTKARELLTRGKNNNTLVVFASTPAHYLPPDVAAFYYQASSEGRLFHGATDRYLVQFMLHLASAASHLNGVNTGSAVSHDSSRTHRARWDRDTLTSQQEEILETGEANYLSLMQRVVDVIQNS